jgi:hypothetical protein
LQDEIGGAVDTEHHGLTVDDNMLPPALQSGLGDPREALGPLIAAARNQADTITIALHAET